MTIETPTLRHRLTVALIRAMYDAGDDLRDAYQRGYLEVASMAVERIEELQGLLQDGFGISMELEGMYSPKTIEAYGSVLANREPGEGG